LKLLIITHTPHKMQNNQWFAYGPYIKEMRLWEKYAKEIHIVAPVLVEQPTVIELDYKHSNITLSKVSAFSLSSFENILKTISRVPGILWVLFNAMRKADHIHLRCPGNIGLLGCMVQVFFPKKQKSAKYAGNWDPNAKQPWSYRFQKNILNNTFLTKNMQVMVYGNWPGTSKNILSFFTASYPEAKVEVVNTSFNAPFTALFVGTLTPGKDPLYAVRLIHGLQTQGVPISLAVYGEGVQRNAIVAYIAEHRLETGMYLHGNQNAEVVERAYKESHFLILPSQSEGWPKAVAESMFWGCIPLATAVSCIPEMLGHGERGVVLTKDLKEDISVFASLLEDKNQLSTMTKAVQNWSQQYTLEAFEIKIKKLLTTNCHHKQM